MYQASVFRLLLVIIFYCISFHSSFAQNKTDYLEASFGFGKMVRNYPEFPTIEKPALIASLKFSRHYNGYKPWHRYYNNPVASLNLTGGSLGNNAVLGYFTGMMAEISFEKRINKSLFWAPRLSLGSAWFSNPYNENQNPENIVIGSSITFLASAELMLGYSVNHSTDLMAKFSILHASNSHFKLPNVGMNVPALSIGVRYKFSDSEPWKPDSVKATYNKKPQLNFRLALGVNESGSSTEPVNGPKYPVYLGSVYVARLFSPVNKVSAGIEAWYNKGVYDYIVSQDFYENDRHGKSICVALVFGHEFLMGHFGLLTTGGIYVYNPFYKERLKRNEIDGTKDKLKSIIPARLGVQYYLKNTFYNQTRNLFVGIYIKTNFGQADFLESGIGYMF
ncbi:MAG TPA: acyloxyacyl hydrolase [Bacteroidia bacterium]|nr:acyloxyacyl hydrolase [Bacteroidia bacterium]